MLLIAPRKDNMLIRPNDCLTIDGNAAFVNHAGTPMVGALARPEVPVINAVEIGAGRGQPIKFMSLEITKTTGPSPIHLSQVDLTPQTSAVLDAGQEKALVEWIEEIDRSKWWDKLKAAWSLTRAVAYLMGTGSQYTDIDPLKVGQLPTMLGPLVGSVGVDFSQEGWLRTLDQDTWQLRSFLGVKFREPSESQPGASSFGQALEAGRNGWQSPDDAWSEYLNSNGYDFGIRDALSALNGQDLLEIHRLANKNTPGWKSRLKIYNTKLEEMEERAGFAIRKLVAAKAVYNNFIDDFSIGSVYPRPNDVTWEKMQRTKEHLERVYKRVEDTFKIQV